MPLTVTPDELRAMLGAAPAPQSPAAPRAAPAPKPRPSPDAPPRPLPIALARQKAEAAAVDALRRAVPLAGAVWSSRCDGIRLKMVKGLLGRAALWTYQAEGRIHTGWLLAGDTRRWRVTLDAATGEVLEAEVKIGRR